MRKILWAGTMCFGTFLIYIGSGIIYSLIINITYGYSVNTQDLYTLLVFFIPGFLIFLEASLLKKRIRRLRVAHDVYDEIEHIGNEIEY
ncbi:MAG: hypothetical protein AB8B65_19755 [Kordia sp.]|uniref:hypothetical protein n=1 Tax=Kordia sp. TaxID=1965332 RepID=UPI00385B6C9B